MLKSVTKSAVIAVALAGVVVLAGCATSLTPEGHGVLVHKQYSNILDGCEKLGAVEVKTKSVDLRNAVRNDVAKKHPNATDFVWLHAEGGFTTKISGYAYRCDK